MKADVVLAGVGGQGVLSIAQALARAAMRQGLEVAQSEVHGMAQRGGAVVAHLRISDRPIHTALVPRGGADVLVSMEPIEALRHLEWLKPEGTLVSATEPVENVPDYPDLERVHDRVRKVPGSVLVDATALAKEAGNALASNMVLVGAASAHMGFDESILEEAIRDLWASKGEKAVESNLKAFRAGRATKVVHA